MQTRPAICPLCEASCGILVGVEGDRPVSVRGDPDDPLSRGHVCPKATALIDLHADPDRLRHPIRRAGSGWERVSWDEALDDIADRLHALQTAHGRDAVGVYLGNPNVHNLGQMTFAPQFWRTLGTRNRFSATSVDQLPHHVAASLMFGHQLLLPVPDVDRTDLLVLLGHDPLVSNGSLWTVPDVRRRLDALRARGGRLVVVDPRRSATAARADEHLPIRPGTDAALLLAWLHVALARGADLGALAPHTDGLEDLRAAVAPYTPGAVAAFCGLPADRIEAVGRALATTRRAVVHARMGASTAAFGGLALWATNALNAVTGHLDAEGGALFGDPAFDPLHPPVGRGVGRGGFGRGRSRVHGRPSFGGEWPVAGLAEEITTPGEGQIRGLLVWAGNPVLSTPDGRRLTEALRTLDLLVSVDPYVNETAALAHYVLPPVGPLARPHYDVIFRMLAVRDTARFADAVVPPDGDLLQDWQIATGLARRLRRRRGGAWAERVTARALEALGPVGVLDLGLRLGRARTSVRALRAAPHGLDLGPLRPCWLARRPPGHRLQLCPAPYVDDLPRLAAALAAPPPELVLVGRRDLRSCNSWLHNSPRLTKGGARSALQVHPDDAARRGVTDGGRAELSSAAGSVEVEVEVTAEVSPGVVSLPHGWGHGRADVGWRRAQALGGVSQNDVTDASRVDALTGNAAFNGTPVGLRPLP